MTSAKTKHDMRRIVLAVKITSGSSSSSDSSSMLKVPIVVNNLRTCETIIWDEASMSSQRMLELVNVIYHNLSDNHDKGKPFGGKQMILVGEFLQLRPVPSDLDEGIFMFHSAVFQRAMTHRFELTEVVRQVHKEFLAALRDIRLGRCSLQTTQYLTALSRALAPEIDSKATHIYLKKLHVSLHNRQALQSITGPEFRFQAESTGNAQGVNWPCSVVLHLKRGCPVMLVWNLNSELKNGCRGVFEDLNHEGRLKVKFPNVGSVLLEKQTWYKTDRSGNVVGAICQYPVVLAYAITCHKSQGLTLPAAVVHCSTEFVPGLTYVAISRVRDPDHLKLINFHAKHLLSPDPRVLRECATDLGDLREDMSCCRNGNLSLDNFSVKERYCANEQYCDEGIAFPSELYDGPTASYFTRDDDNTVTDIVDIYAELAKPDSELSKPPETIVVGDLLAAMRVEPPLSEFASEKNNVLEQLETEEDKAVIFVNLIWCHLYRFFENHLIENCDEVIVNIARGGGGGILRMCGEASYLYQFEAI